MSRYGFLRRRVPRRTILVVTAFVAMVLPPGAVASAAEGGMALGNCTDTFLLAPGDRAAIQEAVPDAYTVVDPVPPPMQLEGVPGGQLWSISTSCHELGTGDRVGPGTLSLVGVAVAPPAGHPAAQDDYTDLNFYLLWALTDRPDVQSALAASGLPAHLVPGLRYSLTPNITGSVGELDAPWPESPYRIATYSTPAVTHPHSHDAYWWHGAPGTHRLLVHHALSTENASDCGVTAAPGTALARLLGSPATRTPCFVQTGVSGTAEAITG